MTSTKRRLLLTSVFLLVGALTLLPISVSAAPSQSDGDNSINAHGNENSNSGDNENSNSGDNENSNSGGNSGSGGNGNAFGGEGNNGQSIGNGGPPNITPSGTIPNQGLPASITPSGVVPADGGVGSVNAQQQVPPHVAAAIVMFRPQAEGGAPVVLLVEAPPASTPIVSGSIIRVLAPVISPAVANVVAAPIVVIEALIDAMAAASQAIVIPFMAGAVVLMAPGLRRRSLLDKALDGDSKKSDHSKAAQEIARFESLGRYGPTRPRQYLVR